MRTPKAPRAPVLKTETDIILHEQRYDDFCAACCEILSALRSDTTKRLSKQQVAHLNHDQWIKVWYTASEDFKQSYREKYPEMFRTVPPITIPWAE